MFFSSFCLSLFLLTPVKGWTQGDLPQDIRLEIVSAKQGAEAKQDAFDQATEQVSQRLAEEVLGPERMLKMWTQVRPKVLKGASRFILFTKSTGVVEAADSTRVQVLVRVSKRQFETLLTESGAMSSGTVRLLPLFEVIDAKGNAYAWWAEGGGENSLPSAKGAQSLNESELFHRQLIKSLNASLKAKNVYLFDPTQASFRMGVPAAYRTSSLKKEDQALLAQFLKADLVLSGRVQFYKARPEAPELDLLVNWLFWLARSQKSIVEFSRQEKLPFESAKTITAFIEQNLPKWLGETARRLGESIDQGEMEMTTLRLTVAGNLNSKQQLEMKRQLLTIREIRSMRERLLEYNRQTYEIESRLLARDLSPIIQRTAFSGFNVQIEEVNEASLSLSVRPSVQ